LRKTYGPARKAREPSLLSLDSYTELMTARDRGYAPQLLAAFLDETEKRMPEITWRKVSDYVWAYPESSPLLGDLTVSFDWDEITLYFGQHHQHFASTEVDVEEDTREIALRTLAFIRELVNDRVVVR
jgi:hypothetical protein